MSGLQGHLGATEYAQGSPMGTQGVIGVRVGGRGHIYAYRATGHAQGHSGAI